MNVTLLFNTPLEVCIRAIRTCWDSFHKSDNCGSVDMELVYRVGNKNKHKSVLEHLVYSFEIVDISRACLQELARHRMASLSVKSTRYTLKELRKEDSFLPLNNENIKRAEKYLVLNKQSELVDSASINTLESLRIALHSGIGNDIAKYCLPESYKTQLVYTINARSLQNFLELRSGKNALHEIRVLAFKLFDALPDSHKYLFSDFISPSSL